MEKSCLFVGLLLGPELHPTSSALFLLLPGVSGGDFVPVPSCWSLMSSREPRPIHFCLCHGRVLACSSFLGCQSRGCEGTNPSYPTYNHGQTGRYTPGVSVTLQDWVMTPFRVYPNVSHKPMRRRGPNSTRSNEICLVKTRDAPRWTLFFFRDVTFNQP